MNSRIFKQIIFSTCIGLTIVACSSEKYAGQPPARRLESVKTVVTEQPGLPWELWSVDRDLEGRELKVPKILEGDSYIKSGDRRKALESYQAVEYRSLAPAGREALTLRLAGTQLSFELAQKALATLSNFFRGQGFSESQVKPQFALLFGYAYGQKGNIDQSLAWFSRAAHPLGDGVALRQSAEVGVRHLLERMSDDDLLKLYGNWVNDSFVYPLVGQERSRRSRGGVVLNAKNAGPLWGNGAIGQVAPIAVNPLTPGEPHQIAVLLPLTGQYGALGRALKNGVELALALQPNAAAQSGADPIKVNAVYRDDAADTLQATLTAKELWAQGVEFLLGPLLSENAKQIGDLARRNSQALISFSKSPDLETGEGVFRLGATTYSQVHSLLTASNSVFAFTKYGIIYPDDALGSEFAQVFKESLQELNLQPVFDRAYAKGDMAALNRLADELDNSDVQAVFFPDSLSTVTRFLSSLTPRTRAKFRALGGANWDNALELSQSRNVLEGSVWVSPFFTSDNRPEVVNFSNEYENRYGRKPDFLAAQGFDAAAIVLEGLRRAEREKLPVASALAEVDQYQGLTGRMSVLGTGEIDREFVVVTMRSGAVQELKNQ